MDKAVIREPFMDELVGKDIIRKPFMDELFGKYFIMEPFMDEMFGETIIREPFIIELGDKVYCILEFEENLRKVLFYLGELRHKNFIHLRWFNLLVR